MAATSMAVEMLKLLLLLLVVLLLLLEDAKSCWDSECRDESFTGASVFLVNRHVESHIAVQPFPLPLLLPLAFLFSRSRALQRPSETRHLATTLWC